MTRIPVNQPLLDGNEKKYLCECIDSGWISSDGPFVSRFEKEFSRRVGRQYGIAVCNGSFALEAAVTAFHIGKGDEVILPAFTIISCASAVMRAGATPVLVDSTADTWCMDVDQIEQKITDKTRAIMVVHIYGLPVDMDPILALADKYHLKIIEDAAEAHGLMYRGRPCGSFGDISAVSFYANKHTTTGEGGMLLTNDPALRDRCLNLRNLFFKPEKRFVHDEFGWNLRMSNLQAAVGVAQLERLDEFVARKRRMGGRYNARLRDLAGVQLPLEGTSYAKNIYWVYGIVLGDEIPFDAPEAMNRLKRLGVETRPFFWPMHEQPVLRKLGVFGNERFPVAERLARRGFYIPSGLALTDEQMDRVCGTLREVLA